MQAVTKRQATERANERHMRNQRTLFDVGIRAPSRTSSSNAPTRSSAGCSLLLKGKLLKGKLLKGMLWN